MSRNDNFILLRLICLSHRGGGIGWDGDKLRLFRPTSPNFTSSLPYSVLINVIIVNFLSPKTLQFEQTYQFSLFYSTKRISLYLFCYLLYYEIFYLFLLWYYLFKHMHNIIQILLEISLIWWDKFSCNFKYIFIYETGFIFS